MTSAKGDGAYSPFRCRIVQNLNIIIENPIPPARVQEHLRLSLFYLHQAEQDYAAIEFYAGRLDVLYTLSVVYHNLGMVSERNHAAELHAQVEKERVEALNAEVDEELKAVMDLITEITARG